MGNAELLVGARVEGQDALQNPSAVAVGNAGPIRSCRIERLSAHFAEAASKASPSMHEFYVRRTRLTSSFGPAVFTSNEPSVGTWRSLLDQGLKATDDRVPELPCVAPALVRLWRPCSAGTKTSKLSLQSSLCPRDASSLRRGGFFLSWDAPERRG